MGVAQHKISPLLIFAVNALPIQGRIHHLAFMCRKKKLGKEWCFGGEMSAEESRRVISAIQEPWGTRGKMARGLRESYNHQVQKAQERRRERTPPGAVPMRKFNLQEAQTLGWGATRLKKTFAIARLYRAFDGEFPMEVNHRWSGWKRAPVGGTVRDVSIGRRFTFALVRPNTIWTGYANAWSHNIVYLIYSVNGTTGSVRVSHKCDRVKEALEYLKPASVSKAEKRGNYLVVPDWKQQVWKVQSFKRCKGRETPFKTATRNRGG